MSNTKKRKINMPRCSICKQKREKNELFSPPAIVGYICRENPECLQQLLSKLKAKEYDARTRELKKAIRKRSEIEDLIQTEVNWWVLHYRDRNEPCCTCGKHKPSIQYAAGHYRSRGSCKELRFELTNIHKQCNVNCNKYGSGMRAEYRDFLEKKYGAGHLDWLDGPHPTLKERFPTSDALYDELDRWRKINSAARKELKNLNN